MLEKGLYAAPAILEEHISQRTFKLAEEELEKLGLSWKIENQTIALGPVPKKPVPKPTPWYGEDEYGNPLPPPDGAIEEEDDEAVEGDEEY